MLTKHSQVKESLHSKLHYLVQKQRTYSTLLRKTRLSTEQQKYYNHHPQQRVLSMWFMTNTNTMHCQCRFYSESINSVTSEQLRKAYAILGLHTSASDAEIKQAYQRYVKLYHPDLWHTSSHSSSDGRGNSDYKFMTNINEINSNSKEEFRVDNIKLVEEEKNVRDEDSNIRDRMAAGNEAYQLLRKMTFAQRQKTLNRTFPLNEFHSNNNYYSYASSTSNSSFDASAPFMNNGSSFHCSPEEYERAQRVYYGEARALRQKRKFNNNSSNNSNLEKKKICTEDSRHVNMSTKEFNIMMNTSKNYWNNKKSEQVQHIHQEFYEHKPSSTRVTSMPHVNKVDKREMQPIMFYEFLEERIKSLKQWIQNVYTLLVNPDHHVTTKATKRIKQTEHIFHNKFDSNSATHKGQDKESANKSTQHNKTHSPFFALHYMTVDAHKLDHLHNMYGREHKDNAKSRQSYSQQTRLNNGARMECDNDNNIKSKCDEVQTTCHRGEPLNKASITNSHTQKFNLPFDKTQPCRLRYVIVDGVPQIVREELVTTASTIPNKPSSHGASSTSTYCQYGLTKRVLWFIEQITPETVIAFFRRMERYVHRTILDKPAIFPSWSTSVYYRHIILYASALAMSCIGFILLDSLVSASDHETS